MGRFAESASLTAVANPLTKDIAHFKHAGVAPPPTPQGRSKSRTRTKGQCSLPVVLSKEVSVCVLWVCSVDERLSIKNWRFARGCSSTGPTSGAQPLSRHRTHCVRPTPLSLLRSDTCRSSQKHTSVLGCFRCFANCLAGPLALPAESARTTTVAAECGFQLGKRKTQKSVTFGLCFLLVEMTGLAQHLKQDALPGAML